ncbi:MAG: segregation/condensation protein A [Candidatus Buchananbacteria bacterium]|nr:segregation/condensation protein A [Candidatus Buchananbacteria bacterium]
MHKVKVEQFEGPLDLLLQLIEQQKLEITKVSLAQVTEQYIQILNQSSQDQIKAEELADFLVVAARLLLIKSKALLPFLQWDEDDETEELTTQLRIYKEYLEATKAIQAMIGKKRFSFSRQKLLTAEEIGFAPPMKLTKEKLADTLRDVIKALNPFLNLPTEVVRKTINIQEKIAHIRSRIFREATTKFSEILKEAKDRTEVIVTFLALLELIKQKTVSAHQVKNFEDIEIRRLD